MLPNALSEPAARQADRSGRRCTSYVLLLVALATGAFFTDLGGPAMYVDEAQYALCVEKSRQSGDWINISPYPPQPYFQKPPMYVWLTRLTYHCFGDGLTRYRFWSALFGVACVGLTCVLGWMLASAEVGLLGGLLLLTNDAFQDDHGARTGSMETAVAFCLLVGVIVYWLLYTGRLRRAAWGWAAVGAAAGLACLFKPAAGVPALGLLALHALIVRSSAPASMQPLRGILLAAAVCLISVTPYFAALWLRDGVRPFHDMFVSAIVQAAAKGDPNTHEHLFRDAQNDPVVAAHFSGQPWYALLMDLHDSSAWFVIAGTGMLFSLVAALLTRGQSRAAHSLLAVIAVGYVVIFSFSAVRRVRYAYPAFAAIALSMAWMYATGLAAVLRRGRPRAGRFAFAWCFAATASLVAFSEALQFSRDHLTEPHPKYPVWDAYRAFQPALRSGRARLVFYGFPDTQFLWRKQMGLDAADCFYLERMRDPIRVNSPADLKRLLADRRPTLLLTSKFVDLPRLEAECALPARSDRRFVYEHRAFVLRGIDLGMLLTPRLTADEPSESLRALDLQGGPLAISNDPAPRRAGSARVFAFTDGFIVRITPPLREDAWLTVTLRELPDVPDRAIRFHALLGNRLMGWEKLGALSQEPRISVRINRGRWGKGANDILIRLLPAAAGDAMGPIRGGIAEISLALFPEPVSDR